VRLNRVHIHSINPAVIYEHLHCLSVVYLSVVPLLNENLILMDHGDNDQQTLCDILVFNDGNSPTFLWHIENYQY